MLKEGRPGLTEEQKADMWRRWKAGYSIREICQALKRNSSPVHAQLAIRGGIAPPGRIRAVVLKLPEREEISRGLGAGESVRSIARRLARAPSTVSRESSGTAAAQVIGPIMLTMRPHCRPFGPSHAG